MQITISCHLCLARPSVGDRSNKRYKPTYSVHSLFSILGRNSSATLDESMFLPTPYYYSNPTKPTETIPEYVAHSIYILNVNTCSM